MANVMSTYCLPTDESLHFQNDLADVVVHRNYVRIDWHPAPMRSHDLRDVYNAALQVLQQQHLTKVLTNHRFMPPIHPEDQHWLSEEWIQRAVTEAGYQYCAVVDAYDSQNRAGTTEVVRQRHLPLTIRHFDNISEADFWLRCA
ncbi:hypothetical protein B0919_17235 [Hymenobacter sp. CRA2]|nr:hypothetical protein B0919_17235 [Hymenobacter sp. CRA2]